MVLVPALLLGVLGGHLAPHPPGASLRCLSCSLSLFLPLCVLVPHQCRGKAGPVGWCVRRFLLYVIVLPPPTLSVGESLGSAERSDTWEPMMSMPGVLHWVSIGVAAYALDGFFFPLGPIL